MHRPSLVELARDLERIRCELDRYTPTTKPAARAQAFVRLAALELDDFLHPAARTAQHAAPWNSALVEP